MGKVIIREFYNNGYGCSCCRRDWENSSWIDEKEMLSLDDLLAQIYKFDKHASGEGGCVGAQYESDGKILYGIKPEIYKTRWDFYFVFGDEDDPCEILIPEKKPGVFDFNDAVTAYYNAQKTQC